jgi:hypothetical protein
MQQQKKCSFNNIQEVSLLKEQINKIKQKKILLLLHPLIHKEDKNCYLYVNFKQ